SAPGTGGLLAITEASFGPLHAKSQATLSALRAAFTGYDVRPTNDSTLSYSVFLGDEKLVWVIPNDDGTLFNVHATSPKVETVGHDWRVGSAFRGSSALTDCECWGDNPTCYRRGGHVAVNLKRSCESVVGSSRDALRLLDGAEIQRVIWSPKPFAGESSDDSHLP
ncbi:MAG TPA: hypothetical protein VIV11_42730, partial [Kofleriaceae bacterium]